jgi:hypothetical protein
MIHFVSVVLLFFNFYVTAKNVNIHGALDWSSRDAFVASLSNSMLRQSSASRRPLSRSSATKNDKRQTHERLIPVETTSCMSTNPPLGIESSFTFVDSETTQWFYGFQSTIWVISSNHTLYVIFFYFELLFSANTINKQKKKKLQRFCCFRLKLLFVRFLFRNPTMMVQVFFQSICHEMNR